MAFRSLPRPSSALDAKAFTLRSYSLDRITFVMFAFSFFFCFLKICSQLFFYSKIVFFYPLKVCFCFFTFFRLLYSFQCAQPYSFEYVVGSSRLELPTSRLSGVCSNLLSYEPIPCPTGHLQAVQYLLPVCRSDAFASTKHKQEASLEKLLSSLYYTLERR